MPELHLPNYLIAGAFVVFAIGWLLPRLAEVFGRRDSNPSSGNALTQAQSQIAELAKALAQSAAVTAQLTERLNGVLDRVVELCDRIEKLEAELCDYTERVIRIEERELLRGGTPPTGTTRAG